MKYFNFDHKKFDYCALIVAKDSKSAMETFIFNVDESLDFLENNLQPIEITEEEAFKTIYKVCDLENVKKMKNDIKAFDDDDPSVDFDTIMLLIDNNLIKM